MSIFANVPSANSSESSSGYSSLSTELNSSDSCKSWNSRTTPSQQQDLRRHSVRQLVDTLDRKCHQMDSFKEFRRALEDPFVTKSILKYHPNSRVKLVKYYQWMEKNSPCFVRKLAIKITTKAYQLPSKVTSSPHELDYVSNLRLGTMLMETGWYAESLLVLDVAKLHSRNLLEKLQVMRVILLAESFSNRHEHASKMARAIQNLLSQNSTIPANLVAAVHQALSVCFFENCQFEPSYYHGMLALQRLSEQQCFKSTIINTYRQLAKSCIAMCRPYQANLLITQAVMWAQLCYGPTSIYYAAVLEDYAFCLLAQNKKSYVDVYASAMTIYRGRYGNNFNRTDVAQGNTALALYIQNVAFRMDTEYMMKNVIDKEYNNDITLDGFEDRLGLAAKRVRALLVADRMYQEVCNPFEDEIDFDLSDRMECHTVSHVQREFNILNINL